MSLLHRAGARSLLRLSGRGPDPAPEMKSEDVKAASIFRRFFHVLKRLEKRDPPGLGKSADRSAP